MLKIFATRKTYREYFSPTKEHAAAQEAKLGLPPLSQFLTSSAAKNQIVFLR
jgi:hypothetical protein